MNQIRPTKRLSSDATTVTKVLFIAFGIATAHAYGSQWIKVTSPHFNIYSTYSAKNTERFATILEEARPYFFRAIGAAAVPMVQDIITVKSEKDYQRFSGSSTSIGTYIDGGIGRGYLVFTGLDLERRETLIHELARSALMKMYPTMPWCMSQGMADVLSTTRWSRRFVKYGGEHILRATDVWIDEEYSVPVKDLLEMDEATLMTLNRATFRIVLGESWAFAHMLMLSDKYSEQFPKVLETIQKGTPVSDAIMTVYHKPMDAVEEEFRTHVNGVKFNAAKVTKPTNDRLAPWPMETMATGDADALQSEVQTARMNRDNLPLHVDIASAHFISSKRERLELMPLLTDNRPRISTLHAGESLRAR